MNRVRWANLFLWLVFAQWNVAAAQFGGAGGGGGNGGGGTGGGGTGGGGTGGGNQNNASGIKIDADGVVTLTTLMDGAGTLKKRRDATSTANLPQDLNRRTKLRYVSLVGLEARLEELYSRQLPIPNELFFLAGLQRIDFVFVEPDESDLVIAGPAEGFVPDHVGRMVGVESGRPTLRLDDLFVAMRTVAQVRQLGCSIDPVPKRLVELQQFIRQGGPATIDEVEARFNRMDDILGMQNVRIDGVPEDSHFATILVEADYRMKRIAIGVENPAITALKSHLALLGTGGNAMQRWWFVPYYDAIYRSEDGLAFQITGQRAQLMAEDELADAMGNRSSAPTTRKTTHKFARQFTEKFAQLADKSPTFAELQNLIDWAVLAAILEKEQIPERIRWKRKLFMDEDRLPHPTFVTPKKIPSSVNYKRIGNQIVGLVGGGVSLSPQSTVSNAIVSPGSSERLDSARATAATTPRVDVHRWWWDEPVELKKIPR